MSPHVVTHDTPIILVDLVFLAQNSPYAIDYDGVVTFLG